jgi:molybdenum cofactor cytidylyltransferase
MRRFVSGLILGAGASQRLGQPKQLVDFRGTTLLGWIVSQAKRSSGLDEVVVVLGRAAEEIRERLDFGSAKVVNNPVFGEGCSSSYRAGIGAISTESDAIMIILGDQPAITPETIDRLAEEWRQSESQIALCAYQGRRGHPMIFARALFSKLIGLHGDKAAWKLVDANPQLVHEVQFGFPPPPDINTASDLEQLNSLEAIKEGKISN